MARETLYRVQSLSDLRQLFLSSKISVFLCCCVKIADGRIRHTGFIRHLPFHRKSNRVIDAFVIRLINSRNCNFMNARRQFQHIQITGDLNLRRILRICLGEIIDFYVVVVPFKVSSTVTVSNPLRASSK